MSTHVRSSLYRAIKGLHSIIKTSILKYFKAISLIYVYIQATVLTFSFSTIIKLQNILRQEKIVQTNKSKINS